VRDLTRSVVVSLESAVPKAHFYRHLERSLDLAFVRDLVAAHYAEAGRPSIDPVVIFKLHLVMFFEGIRSERKPIEIASLNLAHRWYLGYNLDEPLPDHSSLSKIRTRLGLPVFRRFFEVIVEQCVAAGLIWGKELIFDATNTAQGAPGANASMDSIQPALHLVVDDHLAALAETEADAPDGKPHWELLEECRLDPDRPPTSKSGRQSDFRRSPTDPDAALMRPKGERACLGYQSHYVVDGGKARIILHALITPGDVMENQPMRDQLRRVIFRWRVRPKRVIADTTYGTIDNIRAVEESGIRAYVPLPDWEHQRPFFGPARFTYDAAQDVYVCPEGTLLRPMRWEYTAEKVEYRADAAICNACPMKADCTPSDAGRAVHRSFHAEYLERVRGYHTTEAYQKAMRKRKGWIEPLFGEAKQWHGMRRFRLRGLMKVNMEGLFIAAGQNLKRLLSAKGWGCRPWPDGATGFATHMVRLCLSLG
jgi:transposase